ncbi:MAG TPA: hypothetical protein VEK07_23795 [Polyangiaceae bacterium]|nr:hypothetical protein [Polyangiaceae bacterium]
MPSGLVIRTLLLGMVAIAGAAWALVRHCTHELPPLRTSTPGGEVDSGEIPAPELMRPGTD